MSLALAGLRVDDAVDIEPVRAALSRLGFDAAGHADPNRLVALLAKAEASSDGQLRGFPAHHAG